MNKKAPCIILSIALLLTFCSCRPAAKLGEDALASQAVKEEISDTEITRLTDRLMQEAQTVFWWYYSDLSDDLGIDQEAEPLETDGQRWQKVGRFETMEQLKAASEAVFTVEFCKANFYDKIELGKFKEMDGTLYHNDNMGGMGWTYSLPKEYTVQSSDKEKIVLKAVCDGLDGRFDSLGEAEYEFKLTLIYEGNDWKLNNYFNFNPEGYMGDLLLKDGPDVYEAEIRDITNALLGSGMLGRTWREPWSEESVHDLSFVMFYCMMNPDYASEIPASDFELFMHGYFDISTDHLHQMADYNADKKVYEVSVDISVPMLQSQIDDFFRIDSIVQENGKINASYRILWGKMAAIGDGSDTALAGIISFRRAGRFFSVNSVNVTEDHSDKYD